MIYKFGKEIINTAADLTETQNVVDTAFKQSAGEIEQWSKEAINKFGLSELAAKKYASRIMAMSNSMEISHQNGLILSKNIVQLSADLASFYNTDVSDAFESLNAIFTGQIRTLRQYGLNISEANLENYRLSKGIKTAYTAMSEQQKVLLRYNYVMEHTKDIQGDFAKTQITFANQVKLAKMNFASLAGTLGSFLIPVLSTILRYLNAIIVAINSFFGRLAKIAGVQLQHFGGGVELTDGIADGWDNAAGAAAKYKATIAGFDELETLNPQSSGGGGGAGGGGLSGEDLFPDGLLSYDVDDNTQALDVSFNNLIKLIDDKINEIREKSDTLASTFGKNVNGIINYVDWPMLGQTVGDGFNLVTSAVNRFMEEIDFHNLGEKFASSVNSIFDTVDFKETGHKLSLKFNAIIDTVNGFVGKLDFDSIAAGILTHFKTALAEIKWEQAGETLAMGINKVFGLLDDLLNGNIVADLGTKIGVAINTAVANIDAAQIGRVADGLAKQIIAAIKEIDWGLIGNKLNEAFKESNLIGNFIEAIKTAIGIKVNVGGGIFGGLFNLPPTAGKALYGIATAIALIGSGIAKVLGPIITLGAKLALFNGTAKAFAGLTMAILASDVGLKDFGATISSFTAQNLSTIGSIQMVGAMLKGAFLEKFQAIGGVLSGVIGQIAVAFSGSGLVGILALIKTSIVNLFTTIGTFIATNPAIAIVAGIVAVIAAIVDLYKNSEDFRNFFDETWNEKLKPILIAIKDTVGNLWNEHLKPLVKSIGDFVKSTWELIRGVLTLILPFITIFVMGVLGTFQGLLHSIGEIIGGIIDFFTGLITFLSGVFSGDIDKILDGLQKAFGGAFDAIVGLVKVPINAVIGLLNGLFGGVSSKLNGWITKLNSLKIPDWVPGLGGKGFNLPVLPTTQISTLATGGVITSPTMALMGEYANANTNPEIVAPQSLLQSIFDNSNGDVISANSQFARQIIAAIEAKDFYIQIGDDTIAAAAQRGNKNYQRRTGQPLFGL